MGASGGSTGVVRDDAGLVGASTLSGSKELTSRRSSFTILTSLNDEAAKTTPDSDSIRPSGFGDFFNRLFCLLDALRIDRVWYSVVCDFLFRVFASLLIAGHRLVLIPLLASDGH